jgi:hypothetical protein
MLSSSSFCADGLDGSGGKDDWKRKTQFIWFIRGEGCCDITQE